MNELTALLEGLRAFAMRFKGEHGYVLSKGATGVLRWRSEPHDLLHHPSDNPPELYDERRLRPTGHKPNSANDGYRTQIGFMDHYVKFPFGRDPEEGRAEAARELGAYTVLGSLGFRVPHTSVVKDGRGGIGVVSRRIGEGGMDAFHTFDKASPVDYDQWESQDSTLPHPADRIYQPLSEALVLDHDRHTGNMMVDQHHRRWDLDFGTSEADRWLTGLTADDTGMIAGRAQALMGHIAGRAQPDAQAAALSSLKKIVDPDAEDHFDWLRSADKAPYRAVGVADPHRQVISSLRLLRPDLQRVLDQHS